MATCHDMEGWRVISQNQDFDLGLCFEEGVILSVLLGVLFTSAVWQSLSLHLTKPQERSFRSLCILRAKLVLLGTASATGFVNVLVQCAQRVVVPVLHLSIIEPISLIASILLTYLNHMRSRSSSTILLLFWPLYTAVLAVWTRTVLHGTFDYHWLPFSLRWLICGLGLISFVLECLGPEFGANSYRNDTHESPIHTANIFSVWSFGWVSLLMQKGASQVITENDLPSLMNADESTKLECELDKALTKHKLWKALIVAYGRPYAVAAGLKIFQDILAFLQPQLLRWLLAFVTLYQNARTVPHGDVSSEINPLRGFCIAAIMFVASVVQTILLSQYFQRVFETGMRVRVGLIGTIYAKSLVLSNDERNRGTSDIMNLMSVDTTRLEDFCTYGLMIISGPLQIALAFVSLYHLLGWSAFVGVGFMIISIPLNAAVAVMLKKMQEQQMKNRDKRTRLMTELLANIRSIKLYAWEFIFIRKILEVRNTQEMKILRQIGLVTVFNGTLWSTIHILVAFGSFFTAAATSSKPLTPDIIFPALSLFLLLQFPLAMLSQVTSNLIEAIVSIKRLSVFLSAEELQPDARKLIDRGDLEYDYEVLSIEGADFRWANDANSTLENISFHVNKGELLGIYGKVGAGKTSILCAIIGDMIRTDGEVVITGSIAYVPQNPWILSATVRENIIFSHEYDEKFYNLVIKACALVQDLALLSQGDLTEVGEKGITLSGGQRARVALARAVYARADLVLLDDCLAAVDSHVARHIFDDVIGPHGLLASKARILVTNSITFIQQFDQLAFIRQGVILEQGPRDFIMANSEGVLCKLVQDHGHESSLTENVSPSRSTGNITPIEQDSMHPNRSTTLKDPSSNSNKLYRRESFGKARLATPSISRLPPSFGLSKEHSGQGRIKMHIYRQYVNAASKSGFCCFMLATVAQQVASVFASFTLRDWGEHNRTIGNNLGMYRYLSTYGFFSVSATLLGTVSAFLILVFCSLRSARHLHDSMLYSIMCAPLRFFELTPSGRILNLFSRDVYIVDQVLARIIQGLWRTLASCVAIVVVIGSSLPLFLLCVIPLIWFYIHVMNFYLATSRELKRLDSVSRSPILAWFSESLTGLSTIRGFNQQNVFKATNHRRIDRSLICYHPSISVNRWLAIRLEFIGAVLIFIVALLSMTALVTTGIDAGLVGLVLSYALNATFSLNMVVRSASEVEQNIVSVERILHQTDTEQESPQELPNSISRETWPSHGLIEFRGYSTRYRPELELALKDITLTIENSLSQPIASQRKNWSLWQDRCWKIIKPADGTILIDGIDITTVGLHDLRSAISVVPQSPDLFEGTLRENIDPNGQYADADIWAALRQVHLTEYIESLPERLDAPVMEAGSSLSSGQRQLLCFARAMVRKSKILILDEATSAVDLDTDRAIQEIIRGPAFANVTIITIAHRLNTIYESDRVLVMDSGKMAEFDQPKVLLANKDSNFYSLANEASSVDVAAKEADEKYRDFQ